VSATESGVGGGTYVELVGHSDVSGIIDITTPAGGAGRSMNIDRSGMSSDSATDYGIRI
jgi:hypothetical protein